MKIVIFGATGGIGRQLIEQCLAAGHAVTALARKPEVLAAFAARITIIEGNLLDQSSVSEAVKGQDVVLSTFGASSGKDSDIYPKGIATIITAMKEQGVRRIVCVTAAPVDDSPELGFVFGKIIKPLFFQKYYDGMKQLETLLKQSDLDWTLIGPGRLTDATRTGVYRTGTTIPKGGSKIARADVADLLLREASDTQHIHQKLMQMY